MATIEEMLDALAELQAQRDLIEMERARMVDAVLAPVRAELDAVEAEFGEKLISVSEKIVALSEEIKARVIECGKTVKGEHIIAVYNRGRVTWDTEALEGMARLIPQIAQARKEGAPMVILRKR